MSLFDMLNIVMILYEKIPRLDSALLIEIMHNKISNNSFVSIHFATATIKSLQYKRVVRSDKHWHFKCITIRNLGKNILFQCSITLQDQTKRMINVTIFLILLNRMKLPTFIKWTSPVFRVVGCRFSFLFKF